MTKVAKSKASVRVTVPGQRRPNMQDLFDQDRIPLREVLREDGNDYFEAPNNGVDKERYLSQAFYDLEVERMWTKAWQMACREEQIPNVGHYIVYEVADKSVIVVRSGENEIKAFFNSCPHRARMICNTDGHASGFRCRFHGMMWKLDGRLRHLPFRWDFPNANDEDLAMFPVRIARWQGFVFINLDPNAASFDTYISGLEHMEMWDLENRYVEYHVGQIIKANWKVAVEAFIEDLHVLTTHPQAARFVPSGCTQYTVTKERPHWSRILNATGVANPALNDDLQTDAVIMEAMKAQFGCLPGEEADWSLQPGKTARQQISDIMRKRLTYITNGKDYSRFSDSEMVDNWIYPIFPNIMVFGGCGHTMFRFRPWENRVDMSIMEIIGLSPAPRGKPRPRSAAMRLLNEDQKFSDAPEMAGARGQFFDQDLENMEWVQRGLHTTPVDRVRSANYHESPIRHFHRTLDMYISGELPTP